MNNNEVAYLEKALTNDNNENVSKLTFKNVEERKYEIIEELCLTVTETKKLLKKLDDYQYVDELPEIQEGRYLRWINLKNPEKLKLTNGGMLVEIKIEDNVILVLKNNMNRFFQISMDENLIFQRFSDQERVILYAIDYLNK